MWTSAGAPDRYDIFYSAADGGGTIRIAGDGTVLRQMKDGERDIWDTLVGIHHDLLSGDIGGWILGVSGLLLLSNLLVGLAVAWPKRGTWRKALALPTRGPIAARLYGWHRAMGLLLVTPAVLLVAAGTSLAFESAVHDLIGAEEPALPANPWQGGRDAGLALAAGKAIAAIPGSRLAAIGFPTEDDATYRIRVRAAGEIRRAYGGSVVLIDANDGAVRGVYPIDRASPAWAFASALFPLHTGEAAGLAGRILVAMLGLWIAAVVVLGLLLWSRRWRARQAR